jgi:hypothetical protein
MVKRPNYGEVDLSIFPKSVDLGNVSCSVLGDVTEHDVAGKISYIMDRVGYHERKLGIYGKGPFERSQDKRRELTQICGNDDEWVGRVKNAISFITGYDEDQITDDMITKGVKLADFNEIDVSLNNCEYCNDGLRVSGLFGMSYMRQMKESDQFGGDFPMVLGLLQTNDGEVIYGKRGGSRFNETIANIPLGCLVPETDNWLKHTIQEELKEETGIDPNNADIECIGTVVDSGIFSKNTLFLFGIKTDYSFDDIESIWQKSKDKKEHTELIALGVEEVVETMMYKRYDFSVADSNNVPKTTPGNYGAYLPSTIGSTILWQIKNGMMNVDDVPAGVLVKN